MEHKELTTVTIIFYDNGSLELKHEIKDYPKNGAGRIIIPAEFKEDKSIIAVCLGEVTIINKVGDRVIAVDVAEE
ncbi:TIGR02922 family protein [Thalassotalea sp. PLHSN55]|uniref:TIGR02922 family protein n=1 Tax=Thalassotalea sp. PLHSN55 TaxID=3435888 RepID=UPI003F82768B